MRRALYIGRFQPFHLGHVDVVRHMARAPDVDEIVIAIGSAQYDGEHKSPVAPWSVNPFTIDERREMVERSLADAAIERPWSVHAVPDYHDWPKWYRHLEESLPAFDVLYSSDARERAFFAERGKETREFPRVRSFHAGTLRKRMTEGGEWRSALPAGTLGVLDRIDAPARVRALFARDAAESEEEE